MVKGQKATRRAGRRKCQRCKEVFHRTVEETHELCQVCRVTCTRCRKPFTANNPKAPGRTLHCSDCRAEIAKHAYQKGMPSHSKDYRLTKNFGITLNEFQTMLESQGGVCWICKKPPKEGKSLHVDHKHEKGEKKKDSREKRARVRGLLCWKCNTSIAKFRDDPVLLRAAAEYVERWPAQEILKG